MFIEVSFRQVESLEIEIASNETFSHISRTSSSSPLFGETKTFQSNMTVCFHSSFGELESRIMSISLDDKFQSGVFNGTIS
jgi:hypothetical protein